MRGKIFCLLFLIFHSNFFFITYGRSHLLDLKDSGCNKSYTSEILGFFFPMFELICSALTWCFHCGLYSRFLQGCCDLSVYNRKIETLDALTEDDWSLKKSEKFVYMIQLKSETKNMLNSATVHTSMVKCHYIDYSNQFYLLENFVGFTRT